MAIYRKIHVSFWSDSFVSELNDKSKLFYLYLITNERTTQLGVYEITKKQMAYDLGYSIETISKLISELQSANRIKYNDKTCELALRNWNRYNYNPSIKVKSLVDKEITRIKDKSLIQYTYSIDTVSIPNPQEEETETETGTEEETKPKTIDKIPPFEIFSSYAVEKNPKICVKALKLKYDTWVESDWHDGHGSKILNWKVKLLNTLPYIKERVLADSELTPEERTRKANASSL